MVLVIDPQIAGISGDMFLCALVDMGASRDSVIRGVRESAGVLDGAEIEAMEFRRTGRAGIAALELHLEVRDGSGRDKAGTRPGRKGTEMGDAIRGASARLGLSGAASSYASRCIDILLDSESEVHGVGKDSVVFHEASDADTLVDIIGTAIALDDLGLLGGEPSEAQRQQGQQERIVCLPVCVGGGTVSFSHGVVSNPASAILEILKDGMLHMRGSQAGCELTTPTGACMLAALRPDTVGFYPCMQVESIGYGAGCSDPDGFANVLKVVRGTEIAVRHDRKGSTGESGAVANVGGSGRGLLSERVCVLDTNVDDVSGEVIGNVIQRLMDAGAKDVSVYHGLTKKNRPTHLISVVCDGHVSGHLIGLLMSETGTLGVRVSESERVVMPREQLSVQVTLSGRQFEVRYKKRLAPQYADPSFGGGAAGFKIEFDDIRAVSESLAIPVRDAEAMLQSEVMRSMGTGDSGSESGGALQAGGQGVRDRP